MATPEACSSSEAMATRNSAAPSTYLKKVFAAAAEALAQATRQVSRAKAHRRQVAKRGWQTAPVAVAARRVMVARAPAAVMRLSGTQALTATPRQQRARRSAMLH